MRILTVLPLALLLLAGCNRNAADNGADTASTDAPVPVPATAPAAARDDADVSMRYACDADTSVAIVSGNQARVSLPDGRVVSLSKIADSEPPVFTGAALYFAIGSNDAHLSQEQGGNDLTCRPQ